MSLDIHLALNKAKAEQLYPSLSFDEDIHEFIFSDMNTWIDKYALFVKMSDYYSDAYYANEEIEELKRELGEIIPNMKDQRSSEFLKHFIKICDMALEKNQNIYCFCD